MKMNKTTFTVFKSDLPKISFYSALVVDDYGPAKKMLGASLWVLPQIGEIEFADSGEEALKKVGSKQYDLIFLDVSMPGLDGFDTCAQIRKIQGYDVTPIIMVSGDPSSANYIKWAACGCTSYVTKPIQQQPFRELNMKMFSRLEEYKAA
jgi:CheY-like chemotaxis protein